MKKEKKEIKEISNILLNERIKKNEDYITYVTKFGQKMKENIIYEIYNYPEKFVKIEDLQNSKLGSLEFIEGTLTTFLSQNNITCVIEKETSDKDTSQLCLQLITSGEAFRKNFKICTSQGDEKDAIIISNEEEKTKFIKEKKQYYSSILDIPEDEIMISHLEYGSLNYWVRFKDKDLNDEDIKKLEEEAKKKGEDIKEGTLICGLKLSPEMFDIKWNRSEGWGQGEKRGPPGHLVEYDPPLGWYGYGLNVSDYEGKEWLGYKNTEGEWYIAYYGTNIARPILENGFRRGWRQANQYDNNINELSRKEYEKVGIGVYCTPKINVAKAYSEYSGGVTFCGHNYYLVFMCRVNPYKVRMCDNKGYAKDFWVVSGDQINDPEGKKYDDEIRPYRILLKEK